MSTRTPLPTVNERDTENVSAAIQRHRTWERDKNDGFRQFCALVGAGLWQRLVALQSDSTNEHGLFPLLFLPLTGIKADARMNKGAVGLCLPQFLCTAGLASTTHCVNNDSCEASLLFRCKTSLVWPVRKWCCSSQRQYLGRVGGGCCPSLQWQRLAASQCDIQQSGPVVAARSVLRRRAVIHYCAATTLMSRGSTQKCVHIRAKEMA